MKNFTITDAQGETVEVEDFVDVIPNLDNYILLVTVNDDSIAVGLTAAQALKLAHNLLKRVERSLDA